MNLAAPLPVHASPRSPAHPVLPNSLPLGVPSSGVNQLPVGPNKPLMMSTNQGGVIKPLPVGVVRPTEAGKMSPAPMFLPTSVMRKMATERTGEYTY